MSFTTADVWLAGYAAIVLIAAATVLVRREPTLVRGRSVFLFTAAYFALAAAAALWRDGAVPPRLWITAIVVVLITAASTPWWFILGGPRSAVIDTMQVCFGRVCATFEHVERGFVMAVPGGGLHIALHAAPMGRATVVSFSARPAHKKADLFRRLFVKQYRGVLPTVNIRIR